MRRLRFSDAVDDAIGQAMHEDKRILYLGEDVQLIRRNLLVRFGCERIRSAPISESAFVGAAVAAAMAGLRPIVELHSVDFISVAMDALLNHASKLETFSGGRWRAPMVLRTTCGGGYGDGGQHSQSLWGWLAHIPGLHVVVPSIPADAGGLMLTALQSEDPVIFLEHMLLSADLLFFIGSGGRKTVHYDIPDAGAEGLCPSRWTAIPFGKAELRRRGRDVSIISLGLSVHRCLDAAERLQEMGISAGVLDLRTIAPLDVEAICEHVSWTGRMLVVDEDYQRFGLSGELAAAVLEAGIPLRFARVCTSDTIPYARELEDQALPNADRIIGSALDLIQG